MSEPDPAPAAAGAKNALTKKIGPLPVGVWVVVIGAGVGIAYLVNRGQASSAAAAVDGEFTDRLDNTMPGVGGAAGGGGGNALLDAAQSLTGSYSNNEAWSGAALRKLISRGWDPTVADAALRSYLGGNTITQAQKQAIDDALIAVGPPPVTPPMPASGLLVEPAPDKSATPVQTGQGSTPPATTLPAPMTTGGSVSVSYTQRDWGGTGAYTGTVTTSVSQSTVDRIASGNISGYTPREAAELLASAGKSSAEIKAATGWGG